jgi:hypothetical protein
VYGLTVFQSHGGTQRRYAGSGSRTRCSARSPRSQRRRETERPLVSGHDARIAESFESLATAMANESLRVLSNEHVSTLASVSFNRHGIPELTAFPACEGFRVRQAPGD